MDITQLNENLEKFLTLKEEGDDFEIVLKQAFKRIQNNSATKQDKALLKELNNAIQSTPEFNSEIYLTILENNHDSANKLVNIAKGTKMYHISQKETINFDNVLEELKNILTPSTYAELLKNEVVAIVRAGGQEEYINLWITDNELKVTYTNRSRMSNKILYRGQSVEQCGKAVEDGIKLIKNEITYIEPSFEHAI